MEINLLSLLLTFSFFEQSVFLKVLYPSKSDSSSFSVRGSGCGLNWSSGKYLIPSTDNDPTLWTIGLDCKDTDSNLEVKVLLHDQIWMLGANHHIKLMSTTKNESSSSTSSTIYPWFYSRHGSLEIIDNV